MCDAFLEHFARHRSEERSIRTSAPATAPGNPERVRVSGLRNSNSFPIRHTSNRHVPRLFLRGANLLLMGWRA